MLGDSVAVLPVVHALNVVCLQWMCLLLWL